jgi:tripartite-type tricarboxylate transporter receptor subunit TctC
MKSFIAIALMALCACVQAQQYPTKPVRIITPNAPGVSTDVLARLLADRLQRTWSQPVYVENRAGANGVLGTDAVAKSAPDGHTLLVAPAGVFTFHPSLYDKLPYDPLRDFTPVSQLVSTTIWVVVNPALPVKTMKDLLALAKSQPGKLSYTTVGGTIGLPYLSSIVMQGTTGAKMEYVSYKGGNQAVTDLLGNTIQVMFDSAPGTIGHVKNGRLRPLAVISPRRMAAMPEVPTIAESGVPQAEGTAWLGISAPAGTPGEIVRRVHSASVAAVREPEFAAKLTSLGFEVIGNTPEEFVAVIKGEMAHWGKVIRDNGIKAE